MPSPESPPSDPRRPEKPAGANRLLLVGLAVLGALLYVTIQEGLGDLGRRTLSYSEFKRHLEQGEVERCTVGENEIRGRIVPSTSVADDAAFDFEVVRIEDPQLVEALAAAGVEFQGIRPNPWTGMILAWLLPLALLFGLWMLVMRGMGSPGASMAGFGKSRAKLVADRDVGVRFEDVAGCEEAKLELAEIVAFLRDPQRFTALGARIPKGVLVVGPPGTGKTLIARAVAGEARVPFFSLSGSEFVEMFVGVGAARVRDLFAQAKAVAPCIVFIDELDAIGRQRGVHVANVNDEREQTLNQLLVELDGFEPNSGVILLSATNRPDVLDPALLRPGRFDRQVVLDSPDAVGREAILRVHAKGKPLADDVDLAVIARTTPGFSGADLANSMNEAALLAARQGAQQIDQACIEAAVEKVVAGPEQKSRRLGEAEKRRVAFHEAGHALVAAHSKHADPVHKISIVPRGRAALGYTLQLPSSDRHLISQSELNDRLRGLLGGRAAEELILAEVSSGAENDLEQATQLARRAICQYGMGESAGLMHVAHHTSAPFLEGRDILQRDCSEATAQRIDDEVRLLLETAYDEATEVLQTHRDELERIAEALLVHETLDREAFEALIGRTG